MKQLMVAVVTMMACSAMAEMKLGVVDMLVLVRNHANYEGNRALLDSTDKDYQKTLDGIKAEGEALQEQGKKLAEQINPMMSATARAEIEKKLGEIQKQLMGIEQRYRSELMTSRQALQKLEANMLKTTTDDLHRRLDKFAATNGYDLIVDRTAAVFCKPTLDVTEAMLREMGVDPKKARGREDEVAAKAAK